MTYTESISSILIFQTQPELGIFRIKSKSRTIVIMAFANFECVFFSKSGF